jgi:hypothetical protein
MRRIEGLSTSCSSGVAGLFALRPERLFWGGILSGCFLAAY